MLSPNDPIVKRVIKTSLQQAQFEDSRHRLHAEAATSAASASPYWKRLVRDFITPTIPSVSTREQLLRQIAFPLASNELVDQIIDASLAVHYAQDRFINVELSDDKLQADAEEFLERRDIAGFIQRSCHNSLFGAPNSLVVVDAPAIQTTDFPEPYAYLVDSGNIESAKPLTGPNDSGLFLFSFFKTDIPNVNALFDQQEISLWQKDAGSWIEIDRVAHNLPFSPAFKLWPDVESNNPMVSNSILRPLLSLLDRYVFWDGAKELNDLAAAFQMLWYLDSGDCDYITADHIRCQKGFIERPNPVDLLGEPMRSECPACASRKIGGPGSKIKIPAPQKKEDADWRAPAGWISADVENLKYIAEKVVGLANRILQSATGNQSGAQNEQALNEQQILSILEGSRRVGQYLAQHFETLHKRILDALLGMRYGPYYVGCNVNYGRRFNVLSGDQLHLLYESAKKIGATWLIEEIDKMLQDYYARTDVSRSLRSQLITDLDTYPGFTPAELVAAGVNTIDPKGYMLSVGLRRWIRRFEFENNIPIERFGILTDYSKRVITIKESLESYVETADFNFATVGSGDAEQDDESTGGTKPAGGKKPAGNKGGGKSGGKPKGGEDGDK